MPAIADPLKSEPFERERKPVEEKKEKKPAEETSNVLSSGARSIVVNKLKEGDILTNIEVVKDYYIKIRNSDNKELISKIAKNSGFSYKKIEDIVNHVFKTKHKFSDGSIKYFDPDEEIVIAFERLKTKEFTDTDKILLNHEFTELSYMKNKKYDTYEIAHKKANEKYNWQEAIKNANV